MLFNYIITKLLLFLKYLKIVPVNVSVFNTVEHGLPIKLSVLESEDYTLEESSKVKAINLVV